MNTILLDDEDTTFIANYGRWGVINGRNGVRKYAAKNLYLGGGRKNPRRKMLLMHRLIWQHHFGIISPGLFIDHVNGNGLDNRKENLRLVTRTQNNQNSWLYPNNTSGYKGVSFHKRDKVYQASITVNKNRIYLGSFKTAQEASKAYELAASTHFGEYARG